MEQTEDRAPVTADEVTAAVDAPEELVVEQLDALVDGGELRVRSVDGAGWLWWRPQADVTDTETLADPDGFQAELDDRLGPLTDPVAIQERLTPRQHEVFSLASHSGFFESPRARTGAELADELGIAQSTFSYHLRGAQRALSGALFDAE